MPKNEMCARMNNKNEIHEENNLISSNQSRQHYIHLGAKCYICAKHNSNLVGAIYARVLC